MQLRNTLFMIESPIHANVYPITAFSDLRKLLRESYVSCFVIMELLFSFAEEKFFVTGH